MQKSLPIVIVVTTFALAACSGTAPAPTDQSSSDTSTSSTADQVGSAMMESSASSVRTIEVDLSNTTTQSSAMMQTSSADSTVSEARVIEINVSNFAFTPSTIMAKKGEKITLKLVGKEGSHGFAVPDLGINVRIAAGETVSVELPTDKAGTFNAFCSVPCGPGHKDMKATIVIS